MFLIILVPMTGLEPVWRQPRDFKSLVSTNSTTRATYKITIQYLITYLLNTYPLNPEPCMCALLLVQQY